MTKLPNDQTQTLKHKQQQVNKIFAGLLQQDPSPDSSSPNPQLTVSKILLRVRRLD